MMNKKEIIKIQIVVKQQELSLVMALELLKYLRENHEEIYNTAFLHASKLNEDRQTELIGLMENLANA